MSGFHDVLFPLRLARGAVGGPVRRTDVIPLASGREVRVAALAGSRRRWEVASSMTSLEDLAAITAFFEARGGRLHAFRFRDPVDSSSASGSAPVSAGDQLLGAGDGSRTVFQLVKRYGDGAGHHDRLIQLPWPGSVLVRVGDDTLTPAQFGVDGRGRLTLATAPASGVEVRAGFRFDCVVRFDSDSLDVALDAFNAGRTLSIPLQEVVL